MTEHGRYLYHYIGENKFFITWPVDEKPKYSVPLKCFLTEQPWIKLYNP
jgi:hypothetical protein